MAKPAANYPAAILPSYQEQAVGKDITNYTLTQKSDVVLTAIYAGAGLFNLTVIGAFAAWPSYGVIENQTTLEQLVFTRTNNDTLAIILRQFNGTALGAGAIGQNIRYIELTVPGKLLNQICAEITAIQTELGTVTKGSFADVKSRFDGDLFKMPCRVRTTTIGAGVYTAAGGTSARGQLTGMSNANIDGVAIAANNRIFVDNSAASAGIWVVTTLGSGANGVWDRATDFDADAEVKSGLIFGVEEGSIEADTVWELTTNNAIIIGGGSGTVLAFQRIGGPGSRLGVKSLINTDSPYTPLATDFLLLCNCTAGSIIINLPAAANHTGRTYIVKRTDASANTVTLDGNASETIEGSLTTGLNKQDSFLAITCDGSNWRSVGASDYVQASLATGSAVAVTPTGTYVNVAAITLSPGEWDISALCVFTINGATVSACVVALSAFSGNTTTDHVAGDNVAYSGIPSGPTDQGASIPAWRINVAASTNFYLKALNNVTVGNTKAYGRISARRIR